MGISRLVSFGIGAPAEVPGSIVSGPMTRCDEAAQLLPPKVLAPGTEVQLIGGPVVDFIATVDSMAPDPRVWVLPDCMGQGARMAVTVGGCARSDAPAQAWPVCNSVPMSSRL